MLEASGLDLKSIIDMIKARFSEEIECKTRKSFNNMIKRAGWQIHIQAKGPRGIDMYVLNGVLVMQCFLCL